LVSFHKLLGYEGFQIILIALQIPLVALSFNGYQELEEDQLRHAEDLDDIAMCAHVMAILHDKEVCQRLLSCRNEEAQSIINLLQEVRVHVVFFIHVALTVSFPAL